MNKDSVAKNWADIPVYMNTGAYARRHDELEAYRESSKANVACKEAIELAIQKAFDGFYLAKDCELPVVNAFGLERVRAVLAMTLRAKTHDGRFSRDNISWALGYPVPEEPDKNIWYVVQTHPAVLEGFINRIRKMA